MDGWNHLRSINFTKPKATEAYFGTKNLGSTSKKQSEEKEDKLKQLYDDGFRVGSVQRKKPFQKAAT